MFGQISLNRLSRSILKLGNAAISMSLFYSLCLQFKAIFKLAVCNLKHTDIALGADITRH